MRSSVPSRVSIVIGVTALVAGCSNSASGTPAVVSGAMSPVSSSIASSSAPMTVTTVTATVTSTSLAPPPSPTTPSSPPTSTTETSTGPVIPPTDLTGEVYGFVEVVDVPNSQITLDKIDWFTGAAAQQACAEDGVTRRDNNWCTGYYYRNVNPQLRIVAVSPEARIVTLNNGPEERTTDLATVAAKAARPGGSGSTYHLVVTDGFVTELREMYAP